VTADELAVASAALTRGYARNFETAEQVSRAISQIALYDLPDDYFAQFVPRVEAVTPQDVMRVTTEHLDPSKLMTLVVGDLDVVGGDLASLNLGEPSIVPADTI
jgi:predicted Zn-dependent peptidase